MKDDNKKFIIPSEFNMRVNKVMEFKKITIENLCDILNDDIKYEITKANLGIYIQRLPNINFLIALSKALGVSTDYLLGLEDTDLFNTGFDSKYHEKRYKKYECKSYYLYYYPTVSNSPQTIRTATLSITHNADYEAELTIETDEKALKKYKGKLILSNDYRIGYITLTGTNIGEIVHLSFNDPIINSDKVKTELFIGAMISVSSGDLNRMPIMSRFILSRNEIDEAQYDALKANLQLNNKYINIELGSIKKALGELNCDKELKDALFFRLTNAFNKKEYYCFEESYILNTLANDYDLSFSEAMDLLFKLRLKSISNASCKINNKIDARLFDYLKPYFNS